MVTKHRTVEDIREEEDNIPLCHGSKTAPAEWHGQQGAPNLTFNTQELGNVTSGWQPIQLQADAYQPNEQTPSLVGRDHSEELSRLNVAEWEDIIVESALPLIKWTMYPGNCLPLIPSILDRPLTLADYDISAAQVINGILVIDDLDTATSNTPLKSNRIEVHEYQYMEQGAPNLPPFQPRPGDAELAAPSSNVLMQLAGVQPPILAIPPATGREEVIGISTSYPNQGATRQHFTPISTNVHRGRLLVEKILSGKDVESAVLLPKKDVESNFPPISTHLDLALHDGVENGQTWSMRIVAAHHVGHIKYMLKNAVMYMRHHSLKEGDSVAIFLEAPENGHVLKFERRDAMSTFMLNSVANIPAELFPFWIRVARKRLTKSDIIMGFAAPGCIRLAKKLVHMHFPQLQVSPGYPVSFLDFEAKRSWDMRLKYKSDASARMYLLKNVRDFLMLHSLKEGDMVDIWKMDSCSPKYALQTRKL